MTELNQVQEQAQVQEQVQEDQEVTIAATNPTVEEMEQIVDSFSSDLGSNVIVKPTIFNFKKSKDKDTGIVTIRESVNLAIPYVTTDGILAILEAGGKELELLLATLETVVSNRARDLLYKDLYATAASFPVAQTSWSVIANLPKAVRGIPKEVWAAFTQDYVETMPEATGKTVEQVSNMARILGNKLTAIRSNKQVLNLCIEQLAIYADNSAKAVDFAPCIEALMEKADSYLNAESEDLLSNL